MASTYSAEDVFAIAIQIEKNGAAFYRRAAGLRKDLNEKALLESLAQMEDEHRECFEKMKAQRFVLENAQNMFDLEGERALFLRAMADEHGGEGHPDIAELFTGEETIQEIIKTAIDLEKESILFYLGLKDLVPSALGREKIDPIIDQEKKHLVQLTELLHNPNWKKINCDDD